MSNDKSHPRPLKAQIRPHNGAPTLFINDEPASALAYMTFKIGEKYIRQFAQAGVELYSFVTCSDYDYYKLAADVWLGPDEFDYSQYDQRMETFLRACPNAKIFPRIWFSSPDWWDRRHPDELLAGEKGVYDPKPNFGWVQTKPGETPPPPRKMTVPSFSSELWRNEIGEALARFIRYSEERYGHCTLGYHLVTGGSQEWYYYGAFEDTFPDTSRPQQEAFARWLAARGHDGSQVVAVPSIAERTASEFGVFRDPAAPGVQRTVDYLRFHSETLVDAMSHFASMTRRVIGPDKLIGVFYGYFVDLCRHRTCWHNSGHMALQKFLADPNISFNSSPTAYKDRRAADGYSVFNSVTESHRLHNKFWWNENDILTHNSPELKDALFLHPRTELESRHIQRREFGNVLCHGMGSWWFDMWGGYYDDPKTMGDIARMVEIGRKFVHCDRTPTAEIAVVLDDDSIHYLECDNRLTVPLIADQLMQLGHAGAPFATIHVDDLPQASPYKFYIFPNLFFADGRRLEAIRQVTMRQGATSLFFYAPGIISQTGLDRTGGSMKHLCGIALGVDGLPRSLRVRAADRTGLGGLEYGLARDVAVAPTVYAADRQAEILGLLAGTEWAGLVRKQIGGAMVIYSAAPTMPAALLRRLASDAGVRIYADGGQAVYANASFLCISGQPGSTCKLTVPAGPAALYDLFEKKDIAVSDGGAQLPASADGTWVLFRGSGKDWEEVPRP